MTTRYTVRLLSSHGRYPAVPLVVHDFALLAAEDFAWSAVDFPDLDDSHTDRPGARAGAISWLTPDEIRFYGAVSLAEPHPRTNGRLRIHTATWYDVLEMEDDLPDNTAHLLDRSRALAARLLDGGQADAHSSLHPETVPGNYAPSATALLEAMDSSDPLLYRGLYKLLMATELVHHPQFLEESAIAAFTSREAALELIRRKLSLQSGVRLKGKDDVMAHIEATFPTGEPFVEVLRTDWEARVMMAHPVSDYGEHWSPPVEAEECLDALHTLTYLYRYLLLDEVWTPGEYD